ncbi:MAG: tetratricopeptide repeat protein, partial [Vulcanimicrobiaceae bacterium]
PKNAQAHVSYGDYFASQKNIAGAQQQWQLALGIDPNNGPALLALGQVALGQNKTTDAIGYLKRLTAAAPNAQGFALLGQAYFTEHNYAGQRDACSKSFQIQRSPDTLGCIAGADFELKNYKEASQIFDVLDKAAPQFLAQQPEYLFMAGKAYEQTNQRDKALHAYRRVLPLMKRGSPLYKQVVSAIAQLSKPLPPKKKKKG